MFGYKKLAISIFTVLLTIASQQGLADVSEELEFVGKISSSKSVGVIILRDKNSRRTIVTQLGRAFTYEGIVYSVAEVINQGAVVSDGTAQYLLSLIDGKSTEGEAEVTPTIGVDYDSQVVEDYIADQDEVEGEPKSVVDARPVKAEQVLIAETEEQAPVSADVLEGGDDYDADEGEQVDDDSVDDGEWQEFNDDQPSEDEEVDF